MNCLIYLGLEHEYCNSSNSKIRDELLNGEIFYTLKEAKIVIQTWCALQHHPAALITSISTTST